MATSIMDRVGRVSLLQHTLPILAAIIGSNVLAQSAGPAPSASGPATPATAVGAAPSEALQRQALGPYRMILRNAAAPSKPRTAVAHPVSTSPAAAATASRSNPPKPATEPSQPASPAESNLAGATPVTQIASPTVQAVEAQPPAAQDTTLAPMAVAAVTNPTPTPAAVAARTALILVKNDAPTLSGPLARESPIGTVRVAFNVNPDGSTSDFKISASNNRRLNNAVLAAVTKWRYQPIDAVQPTEVEMVFSGD